MLNYLPEARKLCSHFLKVDTSTQKQQTMDATVLHQTLSQWHQYSYRYIAHACNNRDWPMTALRFHRLCYSVKMATYVMRLSMLGSRIRGVGSSMSVTNN